MDETICNYAYISYYFISSNTIIEYLLLKHGLRKKHSSKYGRVTCFNINLARVYILTMEFVTTITSKGWTL